MSYTFTYISHFYEMMKAICPFMVGRDRAYSCYSGRASQPGSNSTHVLFYFVF